MTTHWKLAEITLTNILMKLQQALSLGKQWSTSIRFPNIIKDLRKNCLIANLQFYWKETNIWPLSNGHRKNHSTATLLVRLQSLAVFTDYLKAFDTIGFSILIENMHKFNFSKRFLYCIFTYLTDRRYFVQIRSKETFFKTFLFLYKFWCTTRIYSWTCFSLTYA